MSMTRRTGSHHRIHNAYREFRSILISMTMKNLTVLISHEMIVSLSSNIWLRLDVMQILTLSKHHVSLCNHLKVSYGILIDIWIVRHYLWWTALTSESWCLRFKRFIFRNNLFNSLVKSIGIFSLFFDSIFLALNFFSLISKLFFKSFDNLAKFI